MSVRFWRLESLPTLVAHFQPDAYLILQKALMPLGESMFLFWPGAEQATESHIEKCRKEAAKAARKAAKAAAKAAETAAGSSATHSARPRRVVPRRNQRNPNEFAAVAIADKKDASDAHAQDSDCRGSSYGSASDLSESDSGSDNSDDSSHSQRSVLRPAKDHRNFVNPMVDDDMQEQQGAFAEHDDEQETGDEVFKPGAKTVAVQVHDNFIV